MCVDVSDPTLWSRSEVPAPLKNRSILQGITLENAPILSPISEVKVAKCPRMSQVNDIAEEGVAVE